MIGNAYSIALDFLVEMVAHRLQWTETPISRFSISYLFYVGLFSLDKLTMNLCCLVGFYFVVSVLFLS